MVQLCEKISPNINVIKTNYDNLFPSDYSRFLSSNEFWSLLNGEKILIYQEDSLIFKSDITIDEFMKWDYIGAPWTIYNNDNKAGVGNGGISLRSKSVMMKIMDTISIFDTKYNTSTTEYMNNTMSNVPPEDVYFSKNIEDLNIGSLADRKSAGRFSTESIYSKDCFAGHNFWLRDQNWRDRIHDLMSGLF
jgi:ABC-type sulfate transport system substrate-binding protein